MSFEIVIKNAVDHGEGPHWDDVTQCLYYVDCIVNDVHRFDSVSGCDSKINLGGNPAVSIFIPRRKGGYLATQRVGLSTLDIFESGRVMPLVKLIEDGLVLNDGKCDASGRLWVGSTSEPKDAKGIEDWPSGLGSLFSVDPDCGVKSHLTSLGLPNGIDWSGDGRTMYFAESSKRQVWAFDFDVDAGVIRKMLQSISLPCQRVTSCCFGGKNLDELYVTSSRFLLSPEVVAKTPLAGSLFKVTGLGVKGRKANMFAG